MFGDKQLQAISEKGFSFFLFFFLLKNAAVTAHKGVGTFHSKTGDSII